MDFRFPSDPKWESEIAERKLALKAEAPKLSDLKGRERVELLVLERLFENRWTGIPTALWATRTFFSRFPKAKEKLRGSK